MVVCIIATTNYGGHMGQVLFNSNSKGIYPSSYPMSSKTLATVTEKRLGQIHLLS